MIWVPTGMPAWSKPLGTDSPGSPAMLTDTVKMSDRYIFSGSARLSPSFGAVAGAAREAVSQVAGKAMGLSVGGKIGVARRGEHVAVAVFFTISLVHLNEVCIGLGHRAI